MHEKTYALKQRRYQTTEPKWIDCGINWGNQSPLIQVIHEWMICSPMVDP